MRRTLARLMLPILLIGTAGCGRSDEASLGMLRSAMTEVKASAEVVLAGKQPRTRPELAELVRQIATSDRTIASAEQIATSLGEGSTVRAAALDYLSALRAAVDQSGDRYATAITVDEAKVEDRTVSASIDEARDQAALEQASAEANAKASALAAAVDKAGNAIVERERRLGVLLTALQKDAQPLAGYPLVSHDALAAAMASNAGGGS